MAAYCPNGMHQQFNMIGLLHPAQEDTWWGALVEKSVRAWQYSTKYWQSVHSVLQV